MASSNRFGGAMVQRIAAGTNGDFILAVPSKTGGIANYEKRNDLNPPKWIRCTALTSTDKWDGVSMFQANNQFFQYVAVKFLGNEEGQLFYFRDQDVFPIEISAQANRPGPPAPVAFGSNDAQGVPAFIQSSYNGGDLQVVVPRVGQAGMRHYTASNGGSFQEKSTFGGDWHMLGVSMIQSTYFGNLELVAIQTRGNNLGDLVHYYYDHGTKAWNQTLTLGQNFKGAPVIIESNIGTRGNFEVVVPRRGGGLTHFGRDNDNPPFHWNAATNFGDGNYYSAVSMIQSNYSTTGILDIAALRDDGKIDAYWRSKAPEYKWNGPFPLV